MFSFAAYTGFERPLTLMTMLHGRHHLRRERRRAGYSQVDAAYLLGVGAFKTVSEYERGRHLPPLAVALAYEVMFGIPVARLFPAVWAAARKTVRRRARYRMAALTRGKVTPRTARRERSLEILFARR